MVICLQMGKTYTTKTPPDDFKVTTPENPLLSNQAVTSKGILVPYTNLQLNPYPNTQLYLLCSDNNHEVAWSQNPMMHKHSSFFKNYGKLSFWLHYSSHLWNCALVQLVSPFTTLKNNHYIFLGL